MMKKTHRVSSLHAPRETNGASCNTLSVGVSSCSRLLFPGTKMALKFVTKNKTKLKSFLREYSLTGSLSSSPFVIKVLDVLFETEDSYVFGQEYAPAGDLFDIIPPQVAPSCLSPPIIISRAAPIVFRRRTFNKLSWDPMPFSRWYRCESSSDFASRPFRSAFSLKLQFQRNTRRETFVSLFAGGENPCSA